MTIIEIADYTELPKGVYHEWVAAATLEAAMAQTRRKLGDKVWHWRNLWAFEVER